MDDDFPQSRAEVIAKAASTGDVRGLAYVLSSAGLCVGALAGAYLGFAVAGAFDEGPALWVAALRWPLLMVFVMCLVTEAIKFSESVQDFTSRKNM